jgi:hypothetical protein
MKLELGDIRPAFDPSQYTAVFDHSEIVPQIELAYGRDIAAVMRKSWRRPR